VNLADGGAREAAVGLALIIMPHMPQMPSRQSWSKAMGPGPFDEGLVEDVEHFKEGHVFVDVGDVIADHAAGVLRVFLSPDVKCEFHIYLWLQ